jgi:uncharacterized repeat protein (TIGR04076 family)
MSSRVALWLETWGDFPLDGATLIARFLPRKTNRGKPMPAPRKPRKTGADDTFELYDLKVEVTAPKGGKIYCGAKPGDSFELKGEMLHLPPGQGFSIYSLGALLPLLAAKQRPVDPNDWMATDAEVACPDPNCSTRFKISRTGKRKFEHSATTAVPRAKNKAR